MSLKADATRVALVVLCEALRRLEWPFSVVRFGNRHSQRVLKQAQQVMDNTRGQFCLEAFTWREGTYPATACQFISKHIFR
jgi:hypothetical protein